MRPLFTIFYILLLPFYISAQCVAPVVTSFSPVSASTGMTVTINGNNFNTTPGNNIIYFGASKATAVTASATQLTVVVPLGATFNYISVTDALCKLTGYSTQFFNPISVCPATFSPSTVDTRVDYNSPSPSYGPYGIWFGDFDLDGKTDVLYPTGLQNALALVIARNQSVPGVVDLSSAITISSGAGTQEARNCTVSDIDGDGKLDIVFAVNSTNQIRILRNTSSGPGNFSFAAPISFNVNASPYQVAANDIDQDGKPDIAVGHFSSTLAAVFRNTSTPGVISFASKQDFNMGGGYSVALSDLDGDNKIDLIMGGSGLRVCRNTSTSGLINFAAVVTFAGNGGYRIAVGDLNADGKNEVVFADANVGIFRNTSVIGTFAFVYSNINTGSIGYHRVAISDLNADGKPDIMACYSGGSQVACSLNTTAASGGAITFGATPVLLTGTGCQYALGTADIDGDGNNDVLTGDWCSSRRLNVFRNNALGSIPVTNSVSPTSGLTCNSSVTITYTAPCNGANPGNVFTAQLSDATGSFAVPINIGSVASITSGTITGTIPSCIATGSGYRVRVVSSDPSTTGSVFSTPLNIVCQTITPASISTSTINPTTYCGGASVTIPYTATGSFGVCAPNTFTAQLSDASGSFASPVNIGSLVSNTSGSIAATIPANTPAGNSYRIRVVSTQPLIVGANNGANITINGGDASIDCPDDIFVSADAGLCTAVVNFTATGNGTITYSHPPGSSFPLGQTVVTATATTSCNSVSCTFTITVNGGIDTDNDGTPDACDADDDNDGISDAMDCAPLNPSQLQALSNVSYNTAPASVSFNSPADYTFSSGGSLAGNTGGRTWFFNNINDAAYSGLWWTLNPIANPRHSSQNATGSMVFSSYNSATGIITFISTANMVWIGNSGTENIQTRLRVQLQPYSGLHSNTPLNSGWIDPVTAGLINLNSLSGSYPLIDIKSIAGLKKFQAWFILEEVSSGLPLNVYYNTFPHTSTVGGNIVTSIAGSFFGSTAGSVCNGGNGTVLISGSGGTAPYSGTGSFVVPPGTYNYTITDAAGCSSTTTVNVLPQVDDIDPEISCPSNIEVNTLSNTCTATVTFAATATDNCSASIKYYLNYNTPDQVEITTPRAFPAGLHSVAAVATDPSGNSVNCSFTIKVNDVTEPTFTCPVAQNVSLNATCQLVVPDLVTNLIGSDNCGTVTFTQSPVAGTALSSSHNQTHNVVITADDGNGNTTQCTVVVTGKDVTSPTFTCPVAQNINLNTTCQLVVPDLITGLTGNDNCGTVTFTQSPLAGTALSSSHNQNHNVVITADDGNGNTTQCTVVVTGKDVTDPTFTCPAPQNINLNATCQLVVPDLVTDLTGNDNCGTVTFTQSPVAGSALSSSHNQNHNVVITADDGNGNTTQCTVALTGKDVTQPTFTSCPSDITVTNAAGLCSQVVNFSITATDNCSGSGSASVTTITGDITNSDFNNATSSLFSPAVTASKLTFTTSGYAHSHGGALSIYVDIHNVSTNTWIQVFEKPLASGAQFSFSGFEISFPTQLVDRVRLRSSIGQNQTFHGWNAVTLTLSGTGVSIVSSHPSGFNFPVGTTTVTNTATDAAGNTSTCTFNVIVEDKEAPAVTAPSTVDLECSGDLPAAATTITEFLALTGATATDNCTGQANLLVSSADGALVANNCSGSITRTYTITDAAGNTKTVDHVFTVTDNTIPVITTCPGNGTTFIKNTNNGLCTYKISGTEFDAGGSDNCSGVTMSYSIINEHSSTTVTGTGSLAGVELSFGLNTITWIATDACGNPSASCVVNVDVDKITTTTTLTVTPSSQQYSDKVTLTATVTPYNCAGAGDIGGTVTFKIGTFVLGTANVVNGTATLTTALLEDQLYDANLNDPLNATNGPLKPGAKVVTAHFSGTDPDYIVTNPTAPLSVTCEDADITYNGQTYFTVSPNTNSGTVVLSNYVVDRNDAPTGARGDIRNATATFWNNSINGSVLGTANIPVGLVNPDNKQEGFVTTSFNDVLSNTDITNGGKVYEVWSGLNNYYCGNSDTYTPVTLGLPGQDFVTGGGYIVFGNNSAGTYAGTIGKRMNFGFVMRWNSSGKNLQGRVNVVYRKMVNGVQRIYQIKSNAINSLVVENVNDAGSSATGTNIKFRRATIGTKANLKDITDPLNPIDLGGNYSLTLIGWESTTVTTGALDRISVQLSGSGSIGLLFSSNWSSGKTVHQTLNGGKIQVRNPASPAPGQRIAPEVTANVILRPFAVKALPNPSTSHFNLLVEGNNKEEVYIKVYNGNGALIEHTKGMANQNYILGSSWISGIYIVQIQQGKDLKSVKLVKL